MQINLHCHPNTTVGAVQELSASAGYLSNGGLCFSFDLSGDLAAILIPPAVPRLCTDHLWQHTCFEAFISMAGQDAYHEFNFSPDGRWATYAFSAYRQAAKTKNTTILPAPEIDIQVSSNHLQLNAFLAPEALPPNLRGSTLDIGLSAVLETCDSDTHTPQLSYWALRHPAERPDFHDRRAFVLRLMPVPASSMKNTPT